MRANRNKAEQRIELEPAEPGYVSTQLQITLGNVGLREQRQRQPGRCREQRQRSAWRVEPPYRRRGKEKREREPHELSRDSRQQPQNVETVAALRHIGGQPGVEVAIPEAGKFFEEQNSQTRLEAATHSQEAAGQRQLEHQQGCAEQEQEGNSFNPLGQQSQFAADSQQSAEQQRFEDSAERRHEEAKRDD